MSESKLNLVASILTNSLGTTVIGHVGAENVAITVKYANDKSDTTTSDQDGNFVVKLSMEDASGEVMITAEQPNQSLHETMTLTIEQPAPVVTAVISTQEGQRLLEGRVNQENVSVSVHFIGDEHVISLPVDNSLEFELVLPEDILPSQIEVHATNQETGKMGRTIVSLGVTSKTVAMPALTDEMIAEYVHNEEVKHELASTNSEDSQQIVQETLPVDSLIVETTTKDTNDRPEPAVIASETVQEDTEVTSSRISRRKHGGIRGFFARLFGRKQ